VGEGENTGHYEGEELLKLLKFQWNGQKREKSAVRGSRLKHVQGRKEATVTLKDLTKGVTKTDVATGYP